MNIEDHIDVRNMRDPEHIFTHEEFSQLRIARQSAAAASVVFTMIAILLFLYLVLYHRSKVNRMSLRCAMFCCLANFVENVFFIIMINTRGDTVFCSVAGFVIDYLAILSATLLTLIGINLVLIYVVKIRKQHVVEYYYYPCALFYSACGLIGPAIDRYHIPKPANTKPLHTDTCWYIVIVNHRYTEAFGYMWFYAFIFFATVVALTCSIMAIIKLLIDHQVIHKESKEDQHTSSRKLPTYTRVILRCILYPFVPLITNFCGFIQQCLITKPVVTPEFSLTMASSILHGLGGCFVAFIFLNDPGITHMVAGWYNHWYHKYVIEYVMVETNGGYYLKVIDPLEEMDDQATVVISFVPAKEVKKKKKQKKEKRPKYRPLFCCHEDGDRAFVRSYQTGGDGSNRNDILLGTDESLVTFPRNVYRGRRQEEEDRHLYHHHTLYEEDVDNMTLQRIPMRRLRLDSSAVSQYIRSNAFKPQILLERTFANGFTKEEQINAYTIVISDQHNDYIFVRYPSIHQAKFNHWLLHGCMGRLFYRKSNPLTQVRIPISQNDHRHHHHHHHQYHYEHTQVTPIADRTDVL
ncbi:uncharacterized protein BX664DRAFT_368908 [Halteromyces radiatus]|uniref:uncharacterized protein n=1 Tax=Halteromyces radiatus TaxID=101107 RepID=UPI00221FC7EE|nr:uncharacterized protein BX664DRAFT_368908 [Halteromyces radiatus]KAI8100079.1 hypothetical protein BX664DRAFT_368908 [Halteromyces radiatus]